MGILQLLFGKKGFSRKTVSAETVEKIRRDWQQIDVLTREGGPSQLRQALITADKSLDNALKDRVSGETMGERLKNAKDLFEYSVYDKLWKAHKMRNALVHETGYEPPYHMVISGIEDLKTGLLKLGVRI
jgi:site-specific recombinase XerD